MFLLLLITCKYFLFLWWCYAPILSRITGLARGTCSVGSNVCRAVEIFFHRIRPGVKSRNNAFSLNKGVKQVNMELLPSRQYSRTAKTSSKIFLKYELKMLLLPLQWFLTFMIFNLLYSFSFIFVISISVCCAMLYRFISRFILCV